MTFYMGDGELFQIVAMLRSVCCVLQSCHKRDMVNSSFQGGTSSEQLILHGPTWTLSPSIIVGFFLLVHTTLNSL